MRTLPDDQHLTREDGPTRTCVLTRVTGERQQLIRLVPGPDGAIWPDLAARLPGRGAWIVPDRALIAAAVADGRLRKALARAFRATPPTVPHDLADRIAAGLEARALQRLGLEHRAGHLLFGSEKLGEWARAGRLHLLLHAADAAADGRGKLDQALRVGNDGRDRPATAIVVPAGRLALSAALGRDNMVHTGVTDGRAAARVMADVARWCSYMERAAPEGSGAQQESGGTSQFGAHFGETIDARTPVRRALEGRE
jgi:hypothetical protein